METPNHKLVMLTGVIGIIADYIAHYEGLLGIIRVTTFGTSIAYAGMVLTSKTLYPRWMAIFNPVLLLILSLLLFFIVPAIGKYTLPIALNVGYFMFFVISTSVLYRRCKVYS